MNKKVIAATMVVVMLAGLLVPPKPAKAIAPIIAVVGGAEVAGAVFTGLATLVTGLWLTESRPEITQAEAEEVAAYVVSEWDSTSPAADLMRQQFTDAMQWGNTATGDTTLKDVPTLGQSVSWEPVVVGRYMSDAALKSVLSWYDFSAGHNARPWQIYRNLKFKLKDGYYFQRPTGELITNYSTPFITTWKYNLPEMGVGFNTPDYFSGIGIGDIVPMPFVDFWDIKDPIWYLRMFHTYAMPIVTADGTPVVPRPAQDVYPKMVIPGTADIVVPTTQFKYYPKDVYGTPGAAELEYRPSTKDYIAKDGAIYQGRDVVTTIPVPGVNQKGDVGVDTPAGDWIGTNGGTKIGNPSIPGEGTGTWEKDLSGIRTNTDSMSKDISGIRTDVGTLTKTLTDTTTTEGINWRPLQLAGEDFTRKFPFSIPWDVMRQLSVFDVAPKTPKFKISKTFDMMGYPLKFEIDIDLSLFDGIIGIVRWFLVIIFDIQVILAMRRFMPE
ncbi:hypothetical protein ABEV00_28415 [Paenibacillus thiaminolyticus]|uniref:hypothetical protein n=1 Tax=Paenibacillus thiaminolyticus TaxID=49283 RepID=UPI003D2D99D3